MKKVAKWIPVKEDGVFIGKTWRGDILAAAMLADGSRTTFEGEITIVEANELPEVHAKYTALLNGERPGRVTPTEPEGDRAPYTSVQAADEMPEADFYGEG